MLDDFIYKVDDLRSNDVVTSIVEVDIDVSWTVDRNKQEALFSLVEAYINEDLIESRKVKEVITALNEAFSCQSVEDELEIRNIFLLYSLYARSLAYPEQADEGVYIVECRKDEQKIFSVFIGIENPDIWGFIPANNDYAITNIKTVQAYFRELFSIMGVTKHEYEHLDLLVARYAVLLDDFGA